MFIDAIRSEFSSTSNTLSHSWFNSFLFHSFCCKSSSFPNFFFWSYDIPFLIFWRLLFQFRSLIFTLQSFFFFELSLSTNILMLLNFINCKFPFTNITLFHIAYCLFFLFSRSSESFAGSAILNWRSNCSDILIFHLSFFYWFYLLLIFYRFIFHQFFTLFKRWWELFWLFFFDFILWNLKLAYHILRNLIFAWLILFLSLFQPLRNLLHFITFRWDNLLFSACFYFIIKWFSKKRFFRRRWITTLNKLIIIFVNLLLFFFLLFYFDLIFLFFIFFLRFIFYQWRIALYLI